MDTSKPEEKAIMFYGANHGYKTIQQLYGYDWKASGVYLSEYYKENFTNYCINCFYPNKKTDIYLRNDSDCIIVPNSLRNKLTNEELSSAFDTMCITKKEVFGVPYAYIPTEDNIKILLNYIKETIKNSDKIKDAGILYGTNTYCQLVSAIYYLKYHFGSLFEFTFFMNLEELEKHINNLENTIFSNDFNFENFLAQTYTIEALEEYAKYLFSYGYIDLYLTEPTVLNNEAVIPYIISNLSLAKVLNPQDIWPQYWLSYFETEKALYSQKKEDYQKALSNWEELLENDLLYASPVLKLVYKKMAFCEEKIGNAEKSLAYKEKENDIYSFWDLDYEKFIVYGK